MKKTPKLLVIASYPPKGEKHSKAIVGGAMYAKNTLEAVMQSAKRNHTEPEITVLAETFSGKLESYSEDGANVKRFWKRNTISAYSSLLHKIWTQHKNTKTVVIEFEFAMFGDRFSLMPLPLFVLLLRLTGKRVIFVFHQVVDSLGDMGGHLNLKQSGPKITLLNLFLQTLYRTLLLTASEAIVFEQILKDRLARLGNTRKIAVIPFGTEKLSSNVTKSEARRKLHLPEDAFIVFTFGFIAWYKGSDWLVDILAKDQSLMTKDNIKVIIGGGGNPNHLNKPYYVRYINQVKKTAEETGITVTDFIPEDDMPLYFQAADLVLLPYRTLMSSSGPLSLAFSFGKPFLISEALGPMFLTADMHEALETSGLQKKDVTFPLNDSFPERLTALSKDEKRLKQLAELSRLIAEKRSWDEIGEMYYEIFFGKTNMSS
jgi:glycosyltransferase involved in cell wall biosynthesis